VRTRQHAKHFAIGRYRQVRSWVQCDVCDYVPRPGTPGSQCKRCLERFEASLLKKEKRK
jgi:hypothetical protein